MSEPMLARAADPNGDINNHPLIAHAARNLHDMLGARAIDCAERALQTMRARGDDEGLAMWLAVHAQLSGLSAPPAQLLH